LGLTIVIPKGHYNVLFNNKKEFGPIKLRGVQNDVTTFFFNLLQICEEDNIKYTIQNKGRHAYIKPKTLRLNWHTYGGMPNTWHIKKGYLNGYLYFDKLGHSGWSSLAQKYNPRALTGEERIKTIKFCEDYIQNNQSKFIQPTQTEVKYKDYVLVLGQLPKDEVGKLAHIPTRKLPHLVGNLYKKSPYTVVYKPHPRTEKTPGIKNCTISTQSIHSLLAEAKTVYVVNSGAGFEALIHGKRVITTGGSDYHWVTNSVQYEKELYETINLIDQPVDKEAILTYLHHAIFEFFVDAYDKENIRARLHKALETLK